MPACAILFLIIRSAAFQELAESIGAERVIWRYDPIFFNERYTAAYHLQAFSRIAGALEGYTKRVVISFLDYYPKIRKTWKDCIVKL